MPSILLVSSNIEKWNLMDQVGNLVYSTTCTDKWQISALYHKDYNTTSEVGGVKTVMHAQQVRRVLGLFVEMQKRSFRLFFKLNKCCLRHWPGKKPVNWIPPLVNILPALRLYWHSSCNSEGFFGSKHNMICTGCQNISNVCFRDSKINFRD